MFRKIFSVIITASVLLSCQQDSNKPVEKTSTNVQKTSTNVEIISKEEMTSKVERLKMLNKPLSSKMDNEQIVFTATVKYMNLEGGFFGLITKEGKHWLPMNLKKEFQLDGAVLKVTGYAKKNMMTIQQWGIPFTITHVELIKAGRKTAGNSFS